MKKAFAVFILLFLLCGCTPAPAVADGSIETKVGTVVDRAMNNGVSYIGVLFEDGSSNCFDELKENTIPDNVSIGDRIELTYGFDERTNSWFIIELHTTE